MWCGSLNSLSGWGGPGVVMNLVFDTTETQRLGIEGHVCELQLTTRGFAERAQVRIGPVHTDGLLVRCASACFDVRNNLLMEAFLSALMTRSSICIFPVHYFCYR